MNDSDWIKEVIFDSYLSLYIVLLPRSRELCIGSIAIYRVEVKICFSAGRAIDYVWYAWTHTERMYTSPVLVYSNIYIYV